MASAAAPADGSVRAKDGVVAERIGWFVAVVAVLCGGCCRTVPADAAHDDAEVGACRDVVFWAESEPAVSIYDSDDRAAVPCASDLADAADCRMCRCNSSWEDWFRCAADDSDCAVYHGGGLYAIRRVGARRGCVVRGGLGAQTETRCMACRGPIFCGVHSVDSGWSVKLALLQSAFLS